MGISRFQAVAVASVAAFLTAIPGSREFLGDAVDAFLRVDALQKVSVLVGFVGLFGVVNLAALIPKLNEVASLKAIAESEKKLRQLTENRLRSGELREQKLLEAKEFIEAGTPKQIAVRAKDAAASGDPTDPIIVLEDGLSAINADLIQCYRHLASAYVERSIDADLDGATRAKSISEALAVAETGRDGLSIRIIEARAHAALHDGSYSLEGDTDEYDAEEDEAPENPVQFVSDLCRRSRACLTQGDYFSAHRLALRAKRIAAKWPPPIPLGPDVRNLEALMSLGRSKDVLKQIDMLEPRLQYTGDEEDHFVDWIMYIRTQALCSQGRFEEALDKCNEIVSKLTPRLGDNHPNILTIRSEKSQLLLRLGRLEEALAENSIVIEGKADNAIALVGDQLPAFWIRSKILSELGQHSEALDLLDEVIPLGIAEAGDDHPQVLGLRGDRASLFAIMGDSEEALSESETVVELTKQLYGLHNSNTFAAIYAHCVILIRVGQPQAALSLLDSFQLDQEELLGLNHPDIEAVSTARVQALLDLDQRETAVAHIEEYVSKRGRTIDQLPEISSALSNLHEIASAEEHRSSPTDPRRPGNPT